MLPRIMIREDPEISDLVLQKFREEGVNVLVNHKAQRFAVESGEKVLYCENEGREVRIVFDALLCAVGFEIPKVLGAVLIPKLVPDSPALYGSLGIVVATLAWLAFFGRLIVYGAVVNVTRWEDGHGTLTVPVRAPRIAGAIALEANRSGAVTDRLSD